MSSHIIVIYFKCLPGAAHCNSLHLVSIILGVAIDGPCEALTQVALLEQVIEGDYRDLQGVGEDVSILELVDEAPLAEYLENTFQYSGINQHLNDRCLTLTSKQ